MWISCVSNIIVKFRQIQFRSIGDKDHTSIQHYIYKIIKFLSRFNIKTLSFSDAVGSIAIRTDDTFRTKKMWLKDWK